MTLHDPRTFAASVSLTLLAMSSTLVAAGCSDSDSDSRTRAETLASPSAQRLVGAWKISFWLDRSATTVRVGTDTVPLVGTIAFAEDSHGLISADELRAPTHDGAYDIDFSRFGFETRASGDFPEVIARTSEGHRGTYPTRDSLSIVLNPGSSLFVVRMHGELAADTAAGSWSASMYRSGGSVGHFVMRRYAQ